MKSIAIDIINPKAEKLIKELENIGLIKSTALDQAFIPEKILKQLDKEYENYYAGIGKSYTRKEVFDIIKF